MNQSHSVLILACLVAVALSIQGMKQISTEEGTAMFDCFGCILCDARTTSHFKDMWEETGPEGKVKAFEWIRKIYKMDAKDEPVFWDTFPDIECNKTMDVRKEQVKEFYMEVSKFYETACMEPTGEECVGLNKAVNKARESVSHYTAIGVCENGSQASKKGVQQGQKVGGGMKNAPKPTFMSG